MRALRPGLAALAFVLAIAVAPVAGATLDTRAREAVRSGRLAAMQGVVRDAGRAIGASTKPRAADFGDAIAALSRVEVGIETLREKRESAAENDESALEALYESKEWLRFDHLEGELQYWRGWAYFRRGARAQDAGRDGGDDYRAARRDFARSMRNVRDPAVARELLLATAIAERGAGSAARSAKTLDRIEKLFRDAPEEFKARLQLERARAAHALGRDEAVLALTQNANLATAVGREQADLRLKTLLSEGGQRPSLLAAAARPMLQAGGDAAARAVAALADARLSSAEIARLKLGAEGNALEGLALLREKRFGEAADRLAEASHAPLAGLRDDIVLARLAEAQLQDRRGALAFATCQRIRTRFPKTSLRSQVARYAYAAAQLWSADVEGSSEAAQAIKRASSWVLADAPKSEEAAEVRVRRAMATARRSGPDQALRVLENVPDGAPGSEAVALQKALLRSAKVQTALETTLRRSAATKRQAERLDHLLRKVSGSDLTKEYADDIAIARARARLGLGRAGALELLRGRPASLEVERTRIVGLWLSGDHRAALRATEALVEAGPGTPTQRFRWALPIALAASEHPKADPGSLRTLLARLRERAPANFDSEFRMELGLREASAAQRAGSGDAALALVREVYAEGPTTLSNLILIAELMEEGGAPEPATEVWHEISEVSDREGDAWLRARLGVARSLRATPGRARDGCDVATSLVVSGRSLPSEVEHELRTIAGSCEELSWIGR